MDSLTQIVLGAAVGEATLGRRVGNRAMLWGGLAGTLPDLDVLSGWVTDPMSALAYHRAFTHSFPFALLAAPLLGLVVHRLYGGRAGPRMRNGWLYAAAFALFYLLLFIGSSLMPLPVYGIPAIAAVVSGVFALLCVPVGAFSRRNGPNASPRQWTLLFFLAIVTHPLLDCFTAYGTQFLQPLARLRIAWNTVSVVDPLYTLPFLLLLIAAARQGARTQVRRRLNGAGLLLSTGYLLLTVINAFNVGDVVRDSLRAEGVPIRREVHSPTLGNNLLWSATVQTDDDTYYLGQYSLLDRQRRLRPLRRVAGNHALLADYAGDRDLEILQWFTDGYYTVLPDGPGRVRLADLRYGTMGGDPDDPAAYIFSWSLDTTRHPIRVAEERGGPQGDRGAALAEMWQRMLGE